MMKLSIFWTVLFLILTSCTENKSVVDLDVSKESFVEKEIPNIKVEKNLLTYDNQTSQWNRNGKLFSGYAITKYDSDSMMQKFGVLDGKKQNASTEWYPDGKTRSITHYDQGVLHGVKSVWNFDTEHTLVAQMNFVRGKAEGIQRKWYPTGEVYQILNMKNGREEGVQKAYRKNGVLYANYEARNGRIFGLKKAALCFGLEDQKIEANEK